MLKTALIGTLCASTLPALAQSVTDINKNLEAVEIKLSETQGGAVKLGKSVETGRQEIKRLSAQTRRLSEKVKKTESQSAKLRARLMSLQTQRAAIARQLDQLKTTIAPLTRAALSMLRSPPDYQMFFESPDSAADDLPAHIALRAAAVMIQEKLKTYADGLEAAAKIEINVAKDKERLDTVLAELAHERAALSQVLEERDKKTKLAADQLAKTKDSISALQKKRERLATMLSDLKRAEAERAKARKEKQKEKIAAIKETATAAKAKPKPLKRTLARGLPASGYIVQRFGEPDPDSGLESQGIRIDGEPGGIVTAPVSGEVRYVGAFRGFGNMVIIEDEDGDFSLLAGLDKITMSEGKAVTKGDPLGLLSPSTNPVPQLYYELRRGGKTPVNPLSLF